MPLGDDVRVDTTQVQGDADPAHVAEAAGIRDTIVPVA